jgi:DNA anti-recombination protein RmuC
MRPHLGLCAALAVALLTLPACRGERAPGAAHAVSPTAAQEAQQGPLAVSDVQMFLAVRGKALQRLEDALSDVEQGGGDVLAHVQEVTVAERDASRALGVEWRRFTWVRDQIGRLLTAQRQHEDQRLLLGELTRAKQDLAAQLAAARDPASRQFLEAQLKALSGQLEKLEREQRLPAPKAEEMKLLESSRAEVATLQGRQDRVQHRIQELLQRAAEEFATPRPTAGGR